MIAIITFSATQTGVPLRNFVMVWNVGQGQMVSWIGEDNCSHFDLGGEKFPVEVIGLCRGKSNLLYVTHADFDHINFIPKFQKLVGELCLAQAPSLINKVWQWRYLSGLAPCLGPDGAAYRNTSITTITPTPLRNQSSLKSLNDWSKIYVISSLVLIPGDSTKAMEQNWINSLPHPGRIKYLIAGHHGSNTSSSEELLRELTALKEVVISARKARYGHPHNQVLKRLAKRRARMIRTEVVGHHAISLAP